MGKQWVKQQIKHDEMHQALDHGVRWTSANRQKAGIIAGSVAAVLLLGGLFLYSAQSKQNAAWERLSMAQVYAYSGQAEASIKQIQELTAEYPAAKATGYALLFAGDVLFQGGRYKEAVESYAKLLAQDEPKALLPLALGGTVISQEAAGQCPQARESAERFLQAYADHFLAPQVQGSIARCQEASGSADQAKTTWQKIALQYPESAWAAEAQARLQPPAPAAIKK